jgi:hypothetical protein
MTTLLNNSNIKLAHKEGKEGNDSFNCWGTTLFILNKVQELRWIYREEITDFIEEHTKIIESIDELKTGDILVMCGDVSDNYYHNEEYEPGVIHTAVYVGKNLWFHKRGANESEFLPLECILDCYGHDEYTINRITT